MNNKSLISQKIIKYLRRHYSYYIYENQQEDPEYEHKKEIWELFYYYQYFNPYEVKDYENEEVSFDDMIELMNNRLNDMFSDYISNAYYNDWISDTTFDDYETDLQNYENGQLSYDDFLYRLHTYYLWLINWWLCIEIYDEGGILPQPPIKWQPLSPAPIYRFDPVVIITQDADGNWHTIGVNE